jgi:hypothetical protein
MVVKPRRPERVGGRLAEGRAPIRGSAPLLWLADAVIVRLSDVIRFSCPTRKGDLQAETPAPQGQL